MQPNSQLRNKYLAEYWYLENEKTKIAIACGMSVKHFVNHTSHVHHSYADMFLKALKRQLALLRCLHIIDIIENVIFVNFNKGVTL